MMFVENDPYYCGEIDVSVHLDRIVRHIVALIVLDKKASVE